MPLISVVMPLYNAGKDGYLAAAVESIRRQTFEDWELLLVDDGSTDNTPELARAYAAEDARIRYIPIPHSGLSAACNAGIRHAAGEWIARLDGDDIALPHRFERQLEAAQACPEVGAWASYAYHINGRGDVLGVSPVGVTSVEAFTERRAAGKVIHAIHSSIMVRKALLERVGGYNEWLFMNVDFDLYDRLADYTPVVAIPEPLIQHRIHGSSMSMGKYFKQRQTTRWLEHRNAARLAGKPAMTLGEYQAWYDSRPLPVRVLRNLDDGGRLHYRKAGMLYGQRRYARMLWTLLLAAAMNPAYVIARLWKQRLSPQARGMLAE